MFEVVKKSLSMMDYLILVLAAIVFSQYDYSNLSTSNVIFIVTFGLWLLMLLARIYIVYKNGGGKDE